MGLAAIIPSPIDIHAVPSSTELTGDPKIDLSSLAGIGFVCGGIYSVGRIDPLEIDLNLFQLDGKSKKPGFLLVGYTFPNPPAVGENRTPSLNNKIFFQVVSGEFQVKLVNSKKTSIGNCYVENPATPYTLDCPLYAGSGEYASQWTPDTPAIENPIVYGICKHIPTPTEPYLEVLTSL